MTWSFRMDDKDKHQKRLSLEEEVSINWYLNWIRISQCLINSIQVAVLQDELDKEQKLNQILQCALHGAFVCHSCVSSLAPLQVFLILKFELRMHQSNVTAADFCRRRCFWQSWQWWRKRSWCSRERLRTWRCASIGRETRRGTCFGDSRGTSSAVWEAGESSTSSNNYQD